MITSMKKITVYGIAKDRKTIMESLQKSGCVEINQSQIDDETLTRVDVSDQILQFERYISSAAQALDILDEYVPEKTGLFSARKPISLDYYTMNPEEAKSVGDDVFEIIALSKKIQENKINIGRIQAKILALEPWLGLDVPMNLDHTKLTKIGLYQLPFEADAEKMDELLGQTAELVYYELIYCTKDQSCIFMVYLKQEEERVEKALREAGFVQPSFSLSHRIPQDKVAHLEHDAKILEDEIADMEGRIIEYGQKRESIKLLYDHIILRRDKYRELSKLQLTKEAFILTGFIPQKYSEKMEQRLEQKAVCEVILEDLTDEEEAPVLFENNGFAAPVETITKTYAMPSKNDIDPNLIMSFFYYLFFGMMFSDAGYGILVVIVTGYLAFFSHAEQSTKKTMKMFFFCGISTTFWGLMYGSFFGNVVNTVSLTFFGQEVALKPLWLDPVKDPLTLLIFSVALGMIQIIIGLSIKFYMLWRQGKKLDAVFDVGFWIVLLLGACVLAAGGGLGLSAMLQVGIWMLVAAAVGLVLTQGRDKKNIFAKFFGGIISLYDITSYVSDALSYSRLMALGLATGVIAQVVNTMGTLAGGTVQGAIIFVLIFIVGHGMNFAINMLGAYVHTNRLQYVEFFSKFYEGGGREFAPLAMNTKYYMFTEDEKV